MQATRAGRPKSQEKREAILRAAVQLFLANGVKQTSMEEVAKQASVSKQTIYSHYQNKDALFSAVITFKCEEYSIKNEDLTEHESNLETALTHIGKRFLALFQDEEVISMYSIIIAEARNSPRVAELFYEAGPTASFNALADILYKLSHGTLSENNARLLAVDFYSFLKGAWHMRSLMNLEYKMDEAQSEAHVRTVVAKTLALLHNYYS